MSMQEIHDKLDIEYDDAMMDEINMYSKDPSAQINQSLSVPTSTMVLKKDRNISNPVFPIKEL